MTTEEILLTTDDAHLTLRCRLHRREFIPRPEEVASDLLINARSARDLARRYRSMRGFDLSREAKQEHSTAQKLYQHAFELFRALRLSPELLRRDRYGRLPHLRFERGLAAMK